MANQCRHHRAERSRSVASRRSLRPHPTGMSSTERVLAAGDSLFVVNSRWTTGRWFVGGDFFVAENEALGQLWLAWQQVMEGLHRLSGTATVWPAWLAVVLIVVTFVRSKERASTILVFAMAGAAAVPWYAYQRTSTPRALQPPDGHGVHRVHRNRPRARAGTRAPAARFRGRCRDAATALASRPVPRRSSSSRSAMPSIAKDDGPSPSICATATTAARS